MRGRPDENADVGNGNARAGQNSPCGRQATHVQGWTGAQILAVNPELDKNRSRSNRWKRRGAVGTRPVVTVRALAGAAWLPPPPPPLSLCTTFHLLSPPAPPQALPFLLPAVVSTYPKELRRNLRGRSSSVCSCECLRSLSGGQRVGVRTGPVGKGVGGGDGCSGGMEGGGTNFVPGRWRSAGGLLQQVQCDVAQVRR